MLSRSARSTAALGCLLLLSILGGGLKSANAQNCLALIPANSTINFPKVAVGTQTLTQDIEVTNLCSAPMQVNTFSFGPSQFILMGGWAPITLAQGANMIFEIRFAPTAAQTFTGSATVNVQGYAPIVVNMTGTGFLADAVPTWSASSLTFSSVPLGTTSAPQSVTLKNTGSKGVTISSVYTDGPFSVTPLAPNYSLRPGGSVALPVTFAPSFTGSFDGTLVVTTNNLPATGVTLYGTGVAPTSLAITNFPTLPVVTRGGYRA